MHPTTSRHASPLHAAASREDTFHMDYQEDDGDELVLPADSMGHGSDIEERVQSTQHRLAQLRQEAEELEQEKQRFEELSRQQKEFMNGRAEMGDKLTRALSHLDRETYEAQRRVEQLLVIKDTFNHHLDVIDSLNPEQWNPSDLRHDLGRALGMIDEAREEYIKGSGRIHLLTAGSAQANAGAPQAAAQGHAVSHASAGHATSAAVSHAVPAGAAGLPVMLNKETFRFWLFCGLGFTVPLALTALVIFTAWLIFR
jgi:hypothetical protein